MGTAVFPIKVKVSIFLINHTDQFMWAFEKHFSIDHKLNLIFIVQGMFLDVLARKSLWDVGLDYQHGTGHGIGHFLNVHEGPIGIGMYRAMPDDPGLQENMFVSNGMSSFSFDFFLLDLNSTIISMDLNQTSLFISFLDHSRAWLLWNRSIWHSNRRYRTNCAGQG